MSTQSVSAQAKKDAIETPFTLILEPTSKIGKTANIERRKTASSVAGRRVKAGVRGRAYKDGQGGNITLAGPNNASDTNADQLIYQIPASSSRAHSLVSGFEARYGMPDIQKSGERIWHIKNPNTQYGQAKIITLTVTEKAGQLTINADRMPITRRGELLIKPLRELPKRRPKQNTVQKPRVQPKPVQQQF